MFKVNNRKSCEICLKLPIKEPKRHQWRRSAIFIVNFEHISHLFWCLYYWLNKCQLCWLIYMMGLFFLNRLTQKRVWDVVKHLWWSFFNENISRNSIVKHIYKTSSVTDLWLVPKTSHCVKSVQIRSYFWSTFSYMRTEYGDLLGSIQPAHSRLFYWVHPNERDFRKSCCHHLIDSGKITGKLPITIF